LVTNNEPSDKFKPTDGTAMIALKDTEQLAQLLAEKSGKSASEIIRQALEARARECGVDVKSVRHKPSFARMMEISDRFAKLPVLDGRTPDEIIGYDEFGRRLR
jgi:antitoxin VapB